jgi:hypothetical protein
MGNLFRATRIIFITIGFVLIGYGGWDVLSPFLGDANNAMSWFGLFPLYVGSMLLLIALAMKEDWFTNARRYW